MPRSAVALLVVASLAAACASAPVPAEPVELEVVLADDWAGAPVIGEVIDRFEREHENVDVQVREAAFSRVPEVVAEAVASGRPPDVAHWHAFAAAAAGFAEPLDDRYRAHGLDSSAYLPGAVADVRWGGHLYGVPLDVNALVLMVNEQRLRAAGVSPVELATVDGFRAAAAKVVAEGGADHAIVVSPSSWAAYGWIVALGGELLTIDAGAPRFTFDHPDTIAALQLLVDLIADGIAPPPFAQRPASDAVSSLLAGDVAMYASGSWDLPATRRSLPVAAAESAIRIRPLPQADPTSPRTVLGGSSLFVPRGAPHPELAFELMLALTELEVSIDMAETQGRLPARRAAYEDPLFARSRDLTEFVRQLPTAQVMPLIAYPDVADAFDEGLEDVFAGRRTPADAMAEIQRVAEHRLGPG